MIKKECDKLVKVLRTNKGAKFNLINSVEYCKIEWITHKITMPYTPQQNGVVERRHKTIMNMARSMLKPKRMPNNL